MRDEVKRDLGREMAALWRLFVPRIVAEIGGRFIAVEGRGDEVARLLDTEAGIDVFWIAPSGLIYGVAVRVQFVGRSFDTFTVRLERSSGAPTEYEKRVAALAAPGALVPHLTCHCYASADEAGALSAAMVSTRHLFEFLADPFTQALSKRTNPQDGNTFYYAPWGELQARGASIRTWRW